MLLMHKDIVVADINIANSEIHVNSIYQKKHMPIGTFHDNKTIMDAQVRSWQSHRTIPYNREDVSEIAERLDCSVSDATILGQMLSLTDCYWIKPEKSTAHWHDVNFHENPFSGAYAQLYFSDSHKGKLEAFRFPDFTTDGVIPKIWIMSDGIPYLIKFGGVRSANEVVATKVAKLLEVDHAPYSVVECGNKKGCVCPCFVTNSNTDCVTGLQLKHEYSLSRKELYNHLSRLGLKEDVDKMIVFDDLLHNTDRHENNFSLMYDAEELSLIRLSPLFDSGSCLNWDNSNTLDMRPFSIDRQEQLSFAKRMPFPKEADVADIIRETYELFDISGEQLQTALQDLARTYHTYEEREIDFEISAERER